MLFLLPCRPASQAAQQERTSGGPDRLEPASRNVSSLTSARREAPVSLPWCVAPFLRHALRVCFDNP